MKLNYMNDNIKELVVLNDLYELQKLIQNKEKITEKSLEMEKEIIEIALNYDKGIYVENNYISPNRAYAILLKSAMETEESSIELYSNKIKENIKSVIEEDTYNANYLIRFIKILIDDFKNNKNCIVDEGINEIYGIL